MKRTHRSDAYPCAACGELKTTAELYLAIDEDQLPPGGLDQLDDDRDYTRPIFAPLCRRCVILAGEIPEERFLMDNIRDAIQREEQERQTRRKPS